MSFRSRRAAGCGRTGPRRGPHRHTNHSRHCSTAAEYSLGSGRPQGPGPRPQGARISLLSMALQSALDAAPATVASCRRKEVGAESARKATPPPNCEAHTESVMHGRGTVPPPTWCPPPPSGRPPAQPLRLPLRQRHLLDSP